MEALEEPSWRNVLLGFYHAVDWSETWIQVILSFHVSCYLLFLFTRKSTSVQLGIWFMCLALVGLAPYLNAYGHDHWEEFATQDYFDENGFFVSLVFSTPLLLLSVLILVQLLINTLNLFVDVKRAELKQRSKKKKS